MTPEQRKQVEQIKTKRASLATPLERILFDNDPANGPVALRVIAMTEAEPQRSPLEEMEP